MKMKTLRMGASGAMGWLLAGFVFVMLAVGVFAQKQNNGDVPGYQKLAAVIMGLIGLWFLLYSVLMLIDCRLTLEEEHVEIGPVLFRRTIPYENIRKVVTDGANIGLKLNSWTVRVDKSFFRSEEQYSRTLKMLRLRVKAARLAQQEEEDE